MTDHEGTIDATTLTGPFTISNSDLQAIRIAPSPVISARGDHGIIWAIHPDGRVELGDGYTPDEAAASFWEAVQRLAPDPMTREFGAPLKARINAEPAAGERAQKRVEAITEAVILWRDRPGGDVGLAIALASILDTEQPEPPAATALVCVLRECDRIEREAYGQHDEDADGMREAIRRVRAAAAEASE
ncbi:hypothetical protein [Streptomyces achromogenes]|uniref:hypothetical protein n=1 Tax=Streptomyces achromogenes TaxID=67255 RepID=UPI003A804D7D